MQFNFLHKGAGEDVYPSRHFRHTHRAATVNFPRSYYQSASEAADGIIGKPPLRITSFRRLSSEPGRTDPTKSDVYCLEYPTQWEPNTGMTRHYPIPGRENRHRYDVMVEDAGFIFGNRITFFGRLGSYQYLNMDQAVAQGISTANSYLATTKGA
jgi:UDP-galactopyranose mutase